MPAVLASKRFTKRHPTAVALYENWILEGDCNPNDVREETPDGENARYRVWPPIERYKGKESGWMSLILDFAEHENGQNHFFRAQVAIGLVNKAQAEVVRKQLWEQQAFLSAPFRFFSFDVGEEVSFGLEYSAIGDGLEERYKIVLLDDLLRHAREIFKKLKSDYKMRPFFSPENKSESA